MSINECKPIGEIDILQATKEIVVVYINHNPIDKDDISEVMKKTHDVLMELFNK